MKNETIERLVELNHTRPLLFENDYTNSKAARHPKPHVKNHRASLQGGVS